MAESPNTSRKVLSLEELRARREAARAAGQIVVQCHGCFDIVHPGHIRHLQHAAKLGAVLLVTITGDAEMSKGLGRPLIPQELRAENLAALDCVDWVYIEQRPTAAALLEDVRPDVYVKGREYESSQDPRFQAERDTVERHGGRVVFSSGDIVFSSTALIDSLQDSADPVNARLRGLLEQHDLAPEALDPLVSSFRGLRVCVVGQVIIDTYIMCDRPEIAGESAVMTLRPVERRSFDGGAAVIARHLAAMGARPILVTGLPGSPEGEAMRQRLLIEGVETRYLETTRPLVEKQRFLVGSQKVMKVDLLEPVSLDSLEQRRLIDLAERSAGECHAAIVVDFGQGLLSPGLVTPLCEAIRPHVGVLAGDVSGRRSSILRMRGMDLLCPSEAEMRDALHNYDDGMNAVVWKLLEQTRSRAAIVTLGDQGAIAFDRTPTAAGGPVDWGARIVGEHIPALSPYSVDPLGCGDTLLAAATLAMARGAGVVQAAVLGSVAAAAQVQRVGNAVIGAADLRRGLQRLRSPQLSFTGAPPANPVGALSLAAPA